MNQPLTIECPIATRAHTSPNAAAIVVGSAVVTYAELNSFVEALANEWSYEQGERVCYQVANTLDFVVATWALFRKRAIATPISTRLTDEQAYQRTKQVCGKSLPAFTLTRDGRSADPSPPSLHPNQPATIIFSSGSSGEPKAVVHTLGAHISSAVGSNANIPLAVGDRWLLSLPLYHVGGLSILFRCALAGACAVIPEEGDSLAKSLSLHDITHVSLVATQLKRLMNADFKPSRLKAVLLGGSALPAQLVATACNARFPIHTTYGLTEMASQVTTTDGSAADTMTAGRPLDYREVKIAVDGEILVRGATLCSGYWQADRANEIDSVTNADGWFPTKDVGRLDEKNRLIVTGRKDNMFISGGENIHPEEIENCLLDLPGVEQAMVVAVPDEEYGHRPVAVVDTTGVIEVNTADVETIRDGLLQRMAKFKVPDTFIPWPDDMPSIGIKPDRQRIRKHVERWHRHSQDHSA